MEPTSNFIGSTLFWILLGVLIVIGFVLFLFLQKRKRKKKKTQFMTMSPETENFDKKLEEAPAPYERFDRQLKDRKADLQDNKQRPYPSPAPEPDNGELQEEMIDDLYEEYDYEEEGSEESSEDDDWGGSAPPDDDLEEIELDDDGMLILPDPEPDDGEIQEEYDYEEEESSEENDWGGSAPPDDDLEETAPPKKKDSVNFAGFSPSQMKAGNSYFIDIWAFTDTQFQSVKEIATMLERETISGYKSGLKIDRGTIIGIRLESMSQNLSIDHAIETITWEGEKTNATFAISFDQNAKIGKHMAKATISVAGMSIATLLLNFSVSESESKVYNECQSDFQRINSAFASYASENRADVLARIQGIQTVNPDMDIFVDVLALRSGDNWLDKLTEHVPSKDKFYLFWSKAASESDWVEKEWKLALKQRGLSYIDPIPLDEPHIAPPPKELSSLHFNDPNLPYIKHYQAQKRDNPNN
jgi:hypothetical protein